MNIMDEENAKNNTWEFIKVVLISLAIVLPIRIYIAQPFIVSGESMEPNFHDGEYLIIDELTYQFRQPVRGEVIVFRYPLNPREFFIKRIIGLPGETVETQTGKVVAKVVPNVTMTLKENEYFVMGDNRPHSSDSRFWGALPKDKIMGRTLFRLWPIARAEIL